MAEQNKPAVEPERRTMEERATEFFPEFSTVRAVLESAGIGVWRWDLVADELVWSSNLEAIHHLPPGSFGGTYASFREGIHPDDLARVEGSMQQALRTHAPYSTRYRVTGPNGQGERWLEANGTVRLSENGTPERMLGLSRDITERVNLEAELRNRIRQHETLAQLAERALAEGDLDRLLNDAASTVALTLSVDFVKILELLPGNGELLLRAAFGWNTGLTGTILARTEPNSYGRHTLDSPLPVVTADFAVETRFALPRYLKDHACVSGMTVAIAGRDDRFYGILGVCTRSKREFGVQDAAFLAAVANLLAGAIARRQLEQRHELMIRDMRHRSGNLFSQLLALFSQTAKSSKTMADLSGKYQARVLAMANAHRLITESGWKPTPIMDLLYVLLGPYLDRTSLNGPNVELESDPVFSLSAALHELAENAVKHGSLSRPRGQLDLSWSADRTDRGPTLVIDWVEKNGPPARRPRRLGFGSRLIALVIERQLNGEVTRSFTRKGLSVHMVVPLTHERWPIAAAAEPAAGG